MALIEHLTWPLSVPTATASSTPIPSSTNPWLEPSSILAYITIAVAIVAAVISIAIMWRQLHYGKQRKYREFTWSNLIDTPMLSIDSQAEREKIKILYDGHEVEDINLIQLKVWNSGTDDLEIYSGSEQPSNRFESPYRFVFEGRTVIARSVTALDPPGFIEKDDLEAYNQHPDPETNTISLPHCLLKPKGTFTLRVLLTRSAGEIKIRGQLAGCEVKEYPSNDTVQIMILTLPLLITLVLTALGMMVSTSAILITFVGLSLLNVSIAIIISTIATIVLVYLTFFYGSFSTNTFFTRGPFSMIVARRYTPPDIMK